MIRILPLVAACGLLAAADVAIPLAVFGSKVAQFTVNDKPGVITDGCLVVPADTNCTVAWSTDGASLTVTIVPVTKASQISPPAWQAEPNAVFTGGSTVRAARDSAAAKARTALMRQAAGRQQGTVSGTIEGSHIEAFITVAADAADQPAYAVPAGPMAMARQQAADGTAGAPWVRCWSRALAGKVTIDIDLSADQPAKP